MKRYKVGFHYTECGVAYVIAPSPEDAAAMVEAALDEEGLHGLDNYTTKDREFNALEATEWII